MNKILRVAVCTILLTCVAGLASAHHVTCSRDLNNDGKANNKDTKIIEDAMGSKSGAAPYDERADIDGNSMVNSDDRDAYTHCLPVALMRKKESSK